VNYYSIYFVNDYRYCNRRQDSLASFNDFILITQTFDEKILFSVCPEQKI